jgi:hypothetical protein
LQRGQFEGVPAGAVDDDAGELAAGRLGREQLARQRSRAPAPVDDQHLPRLRLLKRLDDRQEVVAAAHRPGAADHLPEGAHGPQARVHDPDVLVRVAERRGIERGDSAENV